ncbi:UNVERIFIED_CONTAM: cell wall-active antibiotics response protein LiaF [Halobacillus marinus]
MIKKWKTDTINLILFIGVILLIVEIAFFNGGLVFTLFFAGILTYVGKKKYRRMWGRVCFWLGIIILVFTVLSMIAVRFLIVAVLFLFVRYYWKSRKEPERIEPEIIDNYQEFPYQEPLLKQKFFGDQETPDRSYGWRDVNIQGGFGDRIIDLSQTVLPGDEAVISIRHFIGNLIVYVPYEVEVSIHHSALVGRATVFQYKNTKVLNQVLSYETENYRSTRPRVKIITSNVSGDLEVKRV